MRLLLLYLTATLISVGLKIKFDDLNDGTLSNFYMFRFFLTAVIADVGTGYYLSRCSGRLFKPVTIVCSFVFWLTAYANALSVILTKCLPNESVFIVVFDTTRAETIGFLKTVPLSVYIGSLVYWCLWGYLVKKTPAAPTQKGDSLFYGFLFAIFAVFAAATQTEGSFFKKTVLAWQNYQNVKQEISKLAAKEVPAFTTESPQQPRTVVVVIGESANRRVFNENLPDLQSKIAFLKNQPIFIDSAFSPLTATALVIREILFPEKISLIAAYKQAGFKTFWLSNQIPNSKYDNLIYALTQGADERRYMNFSHINIVNELVSSCYDEILLEPLAKALADKAEKKLIFLHLFGSHFPYNNRYPNATEQLFKDQYAASVRYTNTVLSRLLELTASSDNPAVFMYFSDHGSLPDNPFSRPVGHPDIHEIPMFFWLSDAYKQSFKNTPAVLNCLTSPETKEIPSLINQLSGIKINELTVSPETAACLKKGNKQ